MKDEISILFLAIIFFLIWIAFFLFSTQETINIRSFQNFTKECENKSLEETAICLNKNLKEIYNYTLTDDNKTLNFSDLLNNGGDCKQWSELYYKSAELLNYSAQYVVIDMYNNNTAHRVTIMSDKNGYCLLDEIMIVCGIYNNSKWN